MCFNTSLKTVYYDVIISTQRCSIQIGYALHVQKSVVCCSSRIMLYMQSCLLKVAQNSVIDPAEKGRVGGAPTYKIIHFLRGYS